MKITKTGAWVYTKKVNRQNKFNVQLTDFIINFLKDKSSKVLFDFGCSTGYYLKYISEHTNGYDLIGIEPHIEFKEFENIIKYDLAVPFDLGKKGSVICLEVLEHIPTQYELIVIENIMRHCNDYLFVSWARKGQGGTGHCNLKSFDEVLSIFSNKGMEYLEKETMEARNSMTDRRITPWIKNNFLIFKKTKVE